MIRHGWTMLGIFGVCLMIQNTVIYFSNHNAFAYYVMCTDKVETDKAGFYARPYCDYHRVAGDYTILQSLITGIVQANLSTIIYGTVALSAVHGLAVVASAFIYRQKQLK